MRRTITASGIGLVLAVALVSCSELTDPVPNVEVRIAHAAPGLGTATVLLNSIPEFSLAPTASGFFIVRQQPIRYDFVIGADTAGLEIAHDADINALILLDRDEPTLQFFPLDRVVDSVRILIINGDFAAAGSMVVRVAAADTSFEESLAPGDHALIEPGAGSFQLQVQPDGADGFVDLEGFNLINQDHGFLVIAPVPGEGPETVYTRILF